MGDVSRKQQLIPYYSYGSSPIRDSQRFLSKSNTAWFGCGADYSYKAAGAVTQTDSETRKGTAVLGRQTVSSVRAEDCFAA